MLLFSVLRRAAVRHINNGVDILAHYGEVNASRAALHDHDLHADHRLWRKQKKATALASARAARSHSKMQQVNVRKPSAEYYHKRLPDRRTEVLQLYRALIRESKLFFDEHARAKIKEARQSLRCLENANHRHDNKCTMKILELTYGRRGRRRHELLQPYLKLSNSLALTPSMEHVKDLKVDGIPPMSVALYELLKAQSKRIVLGSETGLSPQRQRNAQRRHIRRILSEVTAPLPDKMHKELNEKAQGIAVNKAVLKHKRHSKALPIKKLSQKTHKHIRHKMARERRRQRRWYRHLLLKVPMLTEKPNGAVVVKRDPWSDGPGRLPSINDQDRCGMSADMLKEAANYTPKSKKKKHFKHQVQ
ncbi:hypothetical protein BDF19DRAFT_421237 [Syncephalis fuscata]|nr:hypothetical protein BDF19DRAFT_421237 [Syncephalis fuscata]